MAVFIYSKHEQKDLKFASGSDSIILAGDQTSLDWLDTGQTVMLVEGETTETAEIASTSYDAGDNETTITFTDDLTESYTDAAFVGYFEDLLKQLSGFLDGNDVDASFSCGPEPSEVRMYNTSTPWGAMMHVGTDYSYNVGLETVELVGTPSVGDTVCAFSEGVWLFGSDYVAHGLVTEVIRDVYLYTDSDFDCFYVGLDEIISAEVDSSWLSIGKEVAPDTWEWYGYQTVCDCHAGSVHHLKVKFNLINPSADVHNYYNVPLYIGHLQMPED